MVLRLSKRRFGELSNSQVGRIKNLSVPQLEDLREVLLDFMAMADLEQFLSGLD